MIVDLNTLTETPEFSCDLCVVGSGAAGLAIASEVLHTPFKTLIVESGGMETEPPTQALYDVDLSGLPHPGSTKGRFRICGGSTTQWGGQALPLMSLDLEQRDWIPYSGWPISIDELRPYYTRASRFLRVDERNFDSDLFAYLKAQPPAFNSERVRYHFSKWSPHPSVRERYLADLANRDNCTLLLHANVTSILLEKELNRVKRILVRSLGGQTALVHARIFVLCVGGIETARLLLSNDQQQTRGIGNEHDLVGRFFQDHPSATIGWLDGSDLAAAQQWLNVFHKNGLKYSVRCTAAPKWQRENRTLNVSMGTTVVADNSRLQDAKVFYDALRRRRLDPTVGRKLLSAMLHPEELILAGWHFLVHGRSFIPPGARLQIGLTSEQEPNPASRVMLSDKTDALGIRRSDVRWVLTERTNSTLRSYARMLREEFQRVGIGEIRLEKWVLDDSPQWTEHVTDQYHHMGTTRMNDSPRLGVVNSCCQVHGIANLYIGSSAVFPTSGHSNPTLTIIALCIRLADQLKQELT